MGDVFKEQLVKKENNTKTSLLKGGVVLGGIVLFIALSMITFVQPFMAFLLVAICFGVYFIFSFLNVEYEYIFTNGELDIDCIYNKTRRKRLFSGELKSCEVFAHVNDKGHDGIFSKFKDTLDCSSGIVKNNTYAFATIYKGKKYKVIIEPNENMLQAMTPYLGQRKFFKS